MSFSGASDDKTSAADKTEEGSAGCPFDGIPMADITLSPIRHCNACFRLYSCLLSTPVSFFLKQPGSYLTAIAL